MSPCILVEEKHSPKSLPASIHATTTPTTTDETRRNMKDEEQTRNRKDLWEETWNNCLPS